ncbi:hypothetical protein IscW_ISCW012951 [Ixodes scapularis]|uniref:Uncharacterized protein n=1 Tax=Ixodes scapularis TaxID=6945 RepID=B7QA23_IXOSC|nr:hypothetical protein IscW_ISCW012951 [Ixodes scapularis]|eukprot:XP_002399746.1 hypothetical protein IscW_ISCW012951 [Ixodes scapularis]
MKPTQHRLARDPMLTKRKTEACVFHSLVTLTTKMQRAVSIRKMRVAQMTQVFSLTSSSELMDAICPAAFMIMAGCSNGQRRRCERC